MGPEDLTLKRAHSHFLLNVSGYHLPISNEKKKKNPNFNFRHIAMITLLLLFLAFYFAHSFPHDLIGLLGFEINLVSVSWHLQELFFSGAVDYKSSPWGLPPFGQCYPI